MFFRPKEFIECEEPIDHKGNKTAKDETGFGCVKVILHTHIVLLYISVA